MIGFDTFKDFLDYISQDTAYFIGFLIVFLITGSFIVKFLDIIITKGIVSVLKSIFIGIDKVWNYLIKEKK